MKLRQIGLSLFALFLSALAWAGPDDHTCSASPVEMPICSSADGKTQVALYSMRAYMIDYYNGLGNISFCQDGYLVLGGKELTTADISTVSATSSDYGLKVKNPNGAKVKVQAVFDVSMSEAASKALGITRVIFHYFGSDKRAKMWQIGEDGNFRAILELNCPDPTN